MFCGGHMEKEKYERITKDLHSKGICGETKNNGVWKSEDVEECYKLKFDMEGNHPHTHREPESDQNQCVLAVNSNIFFSFN